MWGVRRAWWMSGNEPRNRAGAPRIRKRASVRLSYELTSTKGLANPNEHSLITNMFRSR